MLVGSEAADAAGKHFERVFQLHNPTEEDHLSLIVDGQAPLALIDFHRQIGADVYLDYWFFGEALMLRKILACVVIVAGALIMG